MPKRENYVILKNEGLSGCQPLFTFLLKALDESALTCALSPKNVRQNVGKFYIVIIAVRPRSQYKPSTIVVLCQEFDDFFMPYFSEYFLFDVRKNVYDF